MAKLTSFTAIDMETFTAERTSACAIGLAKVVAGHIVARFYSVINPLADHRTTDNSAIHGISREMCACAPNFDTLWPTIKKFIGSDTLVSHNAAFDQDVFRHQLEFFGVADPAKYKFICTYELTGLSLEDCCVKHGIEMGNHHDALDDAVACARVMLAENGQLQASTFKGSLEDVARNKAAKKYDRSTLDALDDSQVENKDTPFFHARTVITGLFDAFPNRDELGRKLQSLGADINTSISKKTNIVVVGNGAGPSKLRKIEELRANGTEIRVIYEPELITLLNA